MNVIIMSPQYNFTPIRVNQSLLFERLCVVFKNIRPFFIDIKKNPAKNLNFKICQFLQCCGLPSTDVYEIPRFIRSLVPLFIFFWV